MLFAGVDGAARALPHREEDGQTLANMTRQPFSRTTQALGIPSGRGGVDQLVGFLLGEFSH